MSTNVLVEVVSPRMLAAVRRQVRIGEVGAAWRPALDLVWQFLRAHPGLWTDGHNLFLYRHPASRDLPMEVDFGVEVAREFEPAGEVSLTQTPAGRVAAAVHVGPYHGLGAAHAAIHAWAAANKISFAGRSWEIYGDWNEDTSKLETRVEYLLA